jgi:hypothetical protein
VLAPPLGKALVFSIDDLDFSRRQTNSPHEFLRSILEYNGCFDRKTFVWKEIEGVNVIATVSDESKLAMRVKKMFAVIRMDEDVDGMRTLFQNKLVTAINKNDFSKDIRVYYHSKIILGNHRKRETRSRHHISPLLRQR